MGERVELPFELHPKQWEALFSPATEILYGGSAGGGKSFLARAAVIFFSVEIPGLQTYLFRRLLPDLVKTHVEGPCGLRAMLTPWINKKLVQMTEEEVRFLWNGSKIYLCHCQDERDVYKYLGAEMHLFCPDELTTFSEGMYRFLRSRVRCVGVDIPERYRGMFPRILATSNPGGVGHGWVKRSWIDRLSPGEILEMPKNEGGMRRQYIKATLDDNPSLLIEDPDYELRLEGLGSPELVKAYRDGDWNVIAGSFFPEFSDRHIVRPFKIPAHWTKFRALDWGYARPFCVHWYAVSSGDFGVYPKGCLILYREWFGEREDKENVGLRLTVEEVAQGIKEREDVGEKVDFSVADPSIFKEDGGPSIGEKFRNLGIYFQPADNERDWSEIHARLSADPPMLVVFSTCKGLIRTLPSMQHDDRKMEDLDTRQNDHAVDTLRYATRARPYVGDPPKEDEPLRNVEEMTYDELWASEKKHRLAQI